MQKAVLILVWICGSLACLEAQTGNMRFINFSAKDGMPEKTVYSFAQDDLGFIWIGTANGLYRYDGARFRKFHSPADSADHQISNLLQAMYFDPHHRRLMLGSNNALQWLDLDTYRFFAPDYNSSEIIKILRAEINNFFVDSRGNTWIGTIGNSLYRFDPQTGQVENYLNRFLTLAPGLSKSIWRVFEAPDGRIWSVSGHHLISMNPDGTDIRVMQSHQPFGFTDGYFDTSRNVIWLSAGLDGLVEYNLTTGHFLNTSFPYWLNGVMYRHKITKILPKNKNQIWAIAGNLSYIDLPSGKIVFPPRNGDEFDCRITNLTNLFSDVRQNLWFGSFNNGFGMQPWQNVHILSVPALNANKEYLESLQLTTIDSSSSFLLAGNPMKGLFYYNSSDQSGDYISHPLNALSSHTTSVHATRTGEVYTADLHRLYRVNLPERHLEPITITDQYGRNLSGNYNLLSDLDGHLLLSSLRKGIYLVDLQHASAVFYPYQHIDKEIDTTSSASYIFPDYLDREGNVWFAGSNGVYRMRRGTTVFEKMGTGKSANTQASISKAFGVSQDLRGRYWIATITAGIFQLTMDTSSGQLLNYTKFNSGLPSDYCTDISVDATGYLWIGTSDGIARFDPDSKSVMSRLGKQHGLKQDDAGYGMAVYPNQKLMINGYGNIDILDLKSFRFNTYSPPPLITSIYVMDREINPLPLNSDTAIRLSYDQNYLRIECASLNLTNSNQNTYFYQLQGVDPGWKSVPSGMPITYSGLQSGKYTLRIRSVNNDGLKNETERIVLIRIHPPFWRSWWFLSALGVFISGVLVSLYQYRVRQVRKGEELKSAYALHIAELEMKALRAQMNPHFIFNSLNSIQKYILQNDTFAASKYLTKFSRLIRLILDQSNQNYTLLSTEMEMLQLYIEMESLRFNNKFEYGIWIDPSVHPESVEIPSMLIQPYLENAIWHGLMHKEERGRLTLSIVPGGNGSITATIEDNGIGREKATELKSKQVLKKKSYGMKLTEDRIHIINKTQHINAQALVEDLYEPDGKKATGTRVTLHIPFRPAKIHDS